MALAQGTEQPERVQSSASVAVRLALRGDYYTRVRIADVTVATGFSAATAVIIALIGGRRWRLVVVAMCVIGFLVPALSGVAVKLWLQAHGQPTAPWGVFWVYPVIGLVLFAPIGALVAGAHRCLSCTPDSDVRSPCLWLFGGAMVGTVASMTVLYAGIFSSSHWDDALVFAPLLWPCYLPGALLGGTGGWAMYKARTVIDQREKSAA
jgi:hypothetical protein